MNNSQTTTQFEYCCRHSVVQTDQLNKVTFSLLPNTKLRANGLLIGYWMTVMISKFYVFINML